VIASTTVSESRLICCELASDWRMPETTISLPLSVVVFASLAAGALSCA
jgi:hypothetical protein